LDTLHSVLFYAFAAVTVAGGFATALLGARAGALGLAAVAIGVAGLLADLDAGFAALIALLALGACAVLVLQLPAPARLAADPAGLDRQLGAVLAGLAFLGLAYVAFKGLYHAGAGQLGTFNAAALGRLLLARDAMATEALLGAFLAALVGGGRLLRVRRR